MKKSPASIAFVNALSKKLDRFDFSTNEPKPMAKSLDDQIGQLVEEKNWDTLEMLVNALKEIHDEKEAKRPTNHIAKSEDSDVHQGRFTWYIRTFRSVLGFHREAYQSLAFEQKKEHALGWIERGFSRESGTALNIALNVDQFDVAEALFPKEKLGEVEKEALDAFILPRRTQDHYTAFADWWTKTERDTQIPNNQISRFLALSKEMNDSAFRRVARSWAKNWVKQRPESLTEDWWWSDTVSFCAEAAFQGEATLKTWLSALKTELEPKSWEALISGKHLPSLSQRYILLSYESSGSTFQAVSSAVQTVEMNLLPPKARFEKWSEWCISHGLNEAADVWMQEGAASPTDTRMKKMLSKARAKLESAVLEDKERAEQTISALERRLLVKRTAATLRAPRNSLAL